MGGADCPLPEAGGFFYIVEAHPAARIFPLDEDMPKAGGFDPFCRIATTPAGTRWPPGVDYADPSAQHEIGAHEWQHSLADIFGALLGAGLRIDWFHEFPFCAWNVVAGCEVVERFSSSHGYYALPPSQPQLPLIFSLRASREG